MWHNTGNYAGVMPTGLTVQPYEHAENPETKRRSKNLMDVAGLTDQLIEVSPRPATEQEVLMLHEPDYLERVKVLNETGGDAGVFTPMGVGSYDIALLAPPRCRQESPTQRRWSSRNQPTSPISKSQKPTESAFRNS